MGLNLVAISRSATQMSAFNVINADCRDALRGMADNTVDAVVTDPPYELGFMGKSWDASGIAYDIDLWREVLRVLKPGGHLLAFGGSRTYHRLACAIEDAGFEIRDQIMWVYGSGFPKSLDVSKAIDKVNGDPNRLHKFTQWMRTTGLTARQLDDLTGTNMGGHYLTAKSQPAIPTAALWQVIRPHIADVPDWVDELVDRIEAEREVIGKRNVPIGHSFAGSTYGGDSSNKEVAVTIPSLPEAQRWSGWGTALKPAHEPIVVARKPLDGTVAANVLKHGVAALNIDGCRIGTDDHIKITTNNNIKGNAYRSDTSGRDRDTVYTPNSAGRWPANFIHDGSDEVTELFPETSAGARPAKANKPTGEHYEGGWGPISDGERVTFEGGSAARFFYCAKAGKKERNAGLDDMPLRVAGGMQGQNDGSMGTITMNQNHHPTVKPITLMRYLCRLITPPGGTVLDPFTGSGTTGIAATQEGFDFIGIEQDPEYTKIALTRIQHHKDNK
jgi:DNA modification methylase